ncbi:LytR C-terminal domain-containing protein [Rugamonas sp.]|uniref:LytR C-terminal domain-containing protein n=1 Tax=Rugamonas sp. TaxID=1926287 RepID=UPI0025F108B2|nr:LytR C-terminal domain-containing protein [Rugamonas sp.]
MKHLLRPRWASVLAVCVLQACSGAAPRGVTMAPLLRVSDGDGGDPASAYQLGRSYEQQGALEQAGAAYARSIALAPRQLDARNAQATLLAGQGQLTAAAELLRQVVADFPLEAQPRSNLGYVYYLQHDYPAAQAALEQALTLAPGHPRATANLAQLRRTLRADGADSAVASASKSAASAASTRSASAPESASLSTAAHPAVAAVVVAPTIAAAAPTVAAITTTGRLELVQLSPQEFRLQLRQNPPQLAGADTGAQIQIVNGNGVTGMGERVRRVLERHGASGIASVVNQRRHYQRQTIIEYLAGHQQQASALRGALQGRATLVQARRLPGRTGIRLVLGHDLIAHIGLIDAAAGHPLALNDTAAGRAGLATSNFNQE